MASIFPDFDSEADLWLPGSESEPAHSEPAHSEPADLPENSLAGLSSSELEDSDCRFWPATRLSIIEGLQDETGDAAVWERFVDVYGPMICTFCRKRVPEQDVTEITQEVFWRVFRYVKGLKYDSSQGSFGGWIGAITRNEIRQYFKRKQRDSRGRLSADVLRSVEARTTLGEWEDEYNNWVVQRAMQEVRQEVSAEVWELFELTTHGASSEEVAERFGIGVSRVYKARWMVAERLRQLIQSLSDDYPFADAE